MERYVKNLGFILSILFIPLFGQGQSLENFIQQTDPTRLNYVYSQNEDCPWYDSEAKSAIERVISRSNVTPENTIGDVYLSITAICLQVGQLNTLTAMFNVSFGSLAVLFAKNYGSLGSGPLAGDFSYHIDNLETMVDVAMSDYLRVNLQETSN